MTWDAALTNGQILSQRQQDELWSPLMLNNGLPLPADHDWSVKTWRGRQLIEFGGGVWGFTTCMTRFVEDRLTVIILTNQDSQPWAMCQDVVGLVEPALA